ncbi:MULTISPECIES: ribonuclease domain-containing protein [Acetobacter]|uniref:ribonuclease domain-containing protein n=1 Tax=Acetobacter TaxID=434 RepID=UPI00377075C2
MPPSDGYKGSWNFKNDGCGKSEFLPRSDEFGNPITYKEYDVSPYIRGVNRGKEYLVIGSNGKSYYTSDHYQAFKGMD